MGKIIDCRFLEFEHWFTEKEKTWNNQGVIIEKTHMEEKQGHHYSIGLKSENGLANIVLYESNGMYWVDLEGGNYDYDVMFVRANIQYDSIKDIDKQVAELIEHIIWDGE